ncbi:hypothetical protein O152_gp028 [Pseudomonas phage PaBG]|uniref:Uncharacterized protein n=1 Tax=Pseudomonas phage PaBG TaxID=1335230 RepID=S5VV21_9CAUD|nr:hypothetical protein O152_gp028 [Pseudomonas phage PaBG]AGS81912.1 hypothetical protein PaBG_00028 [Pseudomonas phage PaBG]
MEVKHRRRVVATMYRGLSKDLILTRRFAYFDTALPRMVQLAMNYANEGDFVEFHADELGFQLGIMRIKKGGKWDIEMSTLAKSSPSLMKLMTSPEAAPF